MLVVPSPHPGLCNQRDVFKSNPSCNNFYLFLEMLKVNFSNVADFNRLTPQLNTKPVKNKKPTGCHLLFYCISYRLNMFQALLCPSSGARDYDVDYHIGHIVLGLLYVGGYVQLGLNGVRVAGSSTTAPNLQHTANQE